MGLFDFAKNIGAKLFGDEDEPATQAGKIKNHIEADNPCVTDLDVAVNEGVVSLSGDAMQYPRLFEANREVIKDPDKIYPGQKIRIPLD